MKPVDFRNTTFADLQQNLSAMRETVWQAWLTHGPGTTREVAAQAQIDILTFRPRTTELYQLGLVVLVQGEHGHEGTYRALTMLEWEQWFVAQHTAPVTQSQVQLI